jgi:hypothetical protein
MNKRYLVHALIAATLIGLPAAALAQSVPPTPGPHDRTWQQRPSEQVQQDDRIARERAAAQVQWERAHPGIAWDNRFYTNGYYNNGYYVSGYYNSPYNGYYNNGYYNNTPYYGAGRSGEISGIVSAFSPFNLYLDRGTHVELHQGTIINPTGIGLQPGMRVTVYGNWNSDGSFYANEINEGRR